MSDDDYFSQENINKRHMEWITPKAPFDWRINTRQMMEMSNGVAWVADLIDPSGTVVGQVEQKGNGGMDEVIPDSVEHYKAFKAAVEASYGTFDQEAATGYMMWLEDQEA